MVKNNEVRLIKTVFMKTYKILSIAFIVICVGLLVGVFAFFDFATTQKIVLSVCLCAVIALMAYNLVLIKRKEKEQ